MRVFSEQRGERHRTFFAIEADSHRASRCVAPCVICSMDFPFHKLEIDDFEHHQSWRFVAVAGMWEVPSHSIKRTVNGLRPSFAANVKS